MVNENDVGTAERQRDVLLRISVADHVVIVTIKFLKRAWPWSGKRIKNMLDFDLWLVKNERGVLFLLPSDVVHRVRRVSVYRILEGTRCSPVQAFSAGLRTVSIDCSHLNVASCYLYDINTGDMYPVVARRTKQVKTCLGSELRT